MGQGKMRDHAASRAAAPGAGPEPAPTRHVIILDGTLSSLTNGYETNAGLTYKLLTTQGAPDQVVFYEQGPQWCDLHTIGDVITGRGINGQIRRAYHALARRYRPGDRIFLFGYSRGAYAVRSLVGLIDKIGLLRADLASRSKVVQAFRFYQCDPEGPVARDFASTHCHPRTRIEAVCVWDTVKALGLRLPLLWRLTEGRYAFHSHRLGPSVQHGYHALALDENRVAYAPVLWDGTQDHEGHVEQVWFRGNHGDVGGHLTGYEAARPLANIPLVWMLQRAQNCGLILPKGWESRFPMDPEAPSVSSWRGWGRVFLLRHPRYVGLDPSERVHPTAAAHDHPRIRAIAREKTVSPAQPT